MRVVWFIVWSLNSGKFPLYFTTFLMFNEFVKNLAEKVSNLRAANDKVVGLFQCKIDE